jgi:hypothetical protein
MWSHMLPRSMGESNAVRIRRPLMRHATAKRAAEIYTEKFGNDDGSIPATYQVCQALAFLCCPIPAFSLSLHMFLLLLRAYQDASAQCGRTFDGMGDHLQCGIASLKVCLRCARLST